MAAYVADYQSYFRSLRLNIRPPKLPENADIGSKVCKMRGKKKRPSQMNLFQARLDQIINANHELVQLAQELDWQGLETHLASLYSERGRPAIPVRTIAGMLMLKHLYNQSDESVVARWVENPYWQFFTGETYMQHQPPFNPSDFVHFRKRVGEAGVERILLMTVKCHGEAAQQESEVIADTTVQEKNIAFPTDTRLHIKIIHKCWEIADKEGLDLRQRYNRTLQKLRRLAYNATHPKRRKNARKAQRKIKTIAGRLLREIDRKLSTDRQQNWADMIGLMRQVLAQKKKNKNKIYSLHAPEVACIAKGKAHKKYEFGAKVSLIVGSKSGVVLGAMSFEGNPYDGHTLAPGLEQVERLHGHRPAHATVDRGYQGPRQIGGTQIHLPRRSKASDSDYARRKARKRFRRRAAIEPIIGHLKQDHRMRRNFLKGTEGDKINVLMAAAAFNLKKRLNQIRRVPILAIFRSRLVPIMEIVKPLFCLKPVF